MDDSNRDIKTAVRNNRARIHWLEDPKAHLLQKEAVKAESGERAIEMPVRNNPVKIYWATEREAHPLEVDAARVKTKREGASGTDDDNRAGA